MREVDRLLSTTIHGLLVKEPALAKSLKKWVPYIRATVNDLHRITSKDPLDLTQDLLLAAAEANISYQAKLFRYERHLFEIDMEDGSIVRLCTPRYKKTHKMQRIWVQRDSLQAVKKSTLDSFLYQILSQQYLDMLTLFFTKHNGWRVISQKGKIKEVERFGQEILESSFGIADSDMFQNLFVDPSSNSESLTTSRNLVKKIMERISSDSIVILKSMLEDPESTVGELAKITSMNSRKVHRCKNEIKRIANDLVGLQPIYFEKVSPMYLTWAAA